MLENVDLMTAIVTPFTDDTNEIDFGALEKLANHLLDTGTKGFIVGGTTGETPTLTDDEKIELYSRFVDIVAGRVPVIAGVGSNNTQGTIDLTKKVAEIKGIDAALVVVPYYNKPNQKGMIAHFEAVADATSLPVIIYNIPGRTGVLMQKETVVELSKYPNIAGVKQCHTLEDLEYIVENTADDFAIYSGEDAQALFAKVIGANGLISVAAHVFGESISEMYKQLDSGNYQAAGAIQRDLTPKMAALFMYPSPAPTKAALNEIGYHVGGCRLPIPPLDDEEKSVLFNKLNIQEVIK